MLYLLKRSGGVELEEKSIPVDHDEQENELVLDGGFVVPGTNSFGHTFRSSSNYFLFS